ncbi:MAG TPA: ABC transporter ATP-binding protein [Bryobacteraceae bacterium]|nr:ABC transporter ATP-binding protein [Bryobacteraceae bacterium]
MQSTLEIRNVTKSYGRLKAVNDVSFTVRPHALCGYLGPNGSGKSTTIKMITGLLEPTLGTILYNGQDIREGLIEYKSRLGYVPEEPHLYSYLTGFEYLQLVGELRGLPPARLERKIDGMLRLFSLDFYKHAPISSYSKGMKQKILISAALLHNPEILIFDEPISGLDVTAALVFRDLLARLAREGKIVLCSSHELSFVESVCSEVVILHHGRVVASGSIEELRQLRNVPSLEAVFSDLVASENIENTAAQIFELMAEA